MVQNKEIVEFSGECTYDGDPAEVYIQFELDNDDTFTFSYCSLAQNDKKLELDPSIIIQFLYNPFEAYSRDVLDKEIDSDTQSMMFDAYMELLAEYEAMNEDASTQEQISVENSANELLANDVVGTYEGGDDECIVVKSVTSAGIVVDTMMLNEGGVGGRTICTNIELPYMEGNINQVKFGDDGNISFSDGSIQVSVNGYADTFRKTSNDIEILAECQNESSAEKTESSGNDSGRYIWPDLLDDPGSFMCSWSSDELITEDEMVELDYYGARIVLNEIYARHGRKFKDQELQEHFDSKIWYSGTIEPENFSDSMLNEVEKQNAKILKNFMERHAN